MAFFLGLKLINLHHNVKNKKMQIDILGIVAHPDDAELSFSGTLLEHKKMGYSIGVIDLTQGELGTRGTSETRAEEAKRANEILGLDVRVNLGLADGFFENNKANQLKVVEQIRKFTPKIVITNAIQDRHPDHGRAARLVETSCFLAGLPKIETNLNGITQNAHRPKRIYFSIQSTSHKPDIVIDISDSFEKRMESMYAFKSQFFNPNDKTNEPETFISSERFAKSVEARARDFGQRIGVEFAEGFIVKHQLGVKSLFDLK